MLLKMFHPASCNFDYANQKDEKRYQEMHDVSVEKGINNFSYYEIAKRAIEK